MPTSPPDEGPEPGTPQPPVAPWRAPGPRPSDDAPEPHNTPNTPNTPTRTPAPAVRGGDADASSPRDGHAGTGTPSETTAPAAPASTGGNSGTNGTGGNSGDRSGATARGLPLPPMLLALTVVSGIIDAVSYLALGHVFTANMTGNVAVLGFAAAGSRQFSALRSVVSIGAFLMGATVGGWAARRFAERSRRTWVRLSFGTEAVLLSAACVVAAMTRGTTAGSEYALIAVTAVAMGVRNATVVKLRVADLTTTVLTGTLTGLAADSPLAGGGGARTMRRAGSVLALLAGALLGGWLVLHHSLWLPLLIAAAACGTLALTTSGRA